MPVELVALKQSESNRFYLRHGFVGHWQWPSGTPTTSACPRVQACRRCGRCGRHSRHATGALARAMLAEDFEARWWTSSELFTTAQGFIEAQSTYPEGWSIRVIECARLDDGAGVVADPRRPSAFRLLLRHRSSVCRTGQIIAIDEYWATAETPPAWRDALDACGRRRFDALDDPRALAP